MQRLLVIFAAATIQRRLLVKVQHLLQCNNDHRSYYSKIRQFYGTNNSVCYILLGTFIDIVFLVNQAHSQ